MRGGAVDLSPETDPGLGLGFWLASWRKGRSGLPLILRCSTGILDQSFGLVSEFDESLVSGFPPSSD